MTTEEVKDTVTDKNAPKDAKKADAKRNNAPVANTDDRSKDNVAKNDNVVSNDVKKGNESAAKVSECDEIVSKDTKEAESESDAELSNIPDDKGKKKVIDPNETDSNDTKETETKPNDAAGEKTGDSNVGKVTQQRKTASKDAKEAETKHKVEPADTSKDPKKAANKTKDASNGKSDDKSKVAMHDNDTKEVRKLFDLYVKYGDPQRIKSGLSMANTKKWFKDADIFGDKFGINEETFDEAFKATVKGEDKKHVEFLEFIECCEMLAKKTDNKTPQDLYNQLLTADAPAHHT